MDVSADLDLQTGLVTWTFTSLDPTTLDLPISPMEGFLPPDDENGDGEGYVSYSVQANSGVTTGTVINAQATVVFDVNAPISTASITNTIDTTVPTSSVSPLPATTTSSSFTVAWSGSDGAGSGIAGYDVFVSDDGGSYQPFQTDTTATSATFTGQYGHSYAFYSVATSDVGLVQPTPAAAQATTLLVALPTSSVSPLPAVTPGTSLTVSWSGSPGAGATSIASYEVFVSEDGGAFQPFLASTTATSATFAGQYGHTYAFYSVATDNLGDRQATPGQPQATITIAPLVTMTGVRDVLNKKHQVTEVIVTFSGAVNVGEADNPATYRLATAGKKGSFTAKNAKVIALRSAAYTAANDSVTLTARKAFALTKPVQLLVHGQPPSGLRDGLGRLIDGNRDGQPGGDAIAVLTRGGATMSALARIAASPAIALRHSAVERRTGAMESLAFKSPGQLSCGRAWLSSRQPSP